MNRYENKNKSPPIRLPLEKLRNLQEEIDRRLMRAAQLEFASHYYEKYKEALASNSKAGEFHERKPMF